MEFEFLETDITIWAVMFIAMFIACLIVVWKPYILANRNREMKGEDTECFYKPYLYIFLINVLVVLTFMAAAIDMIKGWGYGEMLIDPSMSALAVTFVLSFIVVIVLQDAIKVFVNDYQAKLKDKGLWKSIVCIVNDIKEVISQPKKPND